MDMHRAIGRHETASGSSDRSALCHSLVSALLGGACLTGTAALANEAAMQAFADHCFRPTMTADRTQDVLIPTGARVDFYDLDPFVSSNAPSPAMGRAMTAGTDRRCEVAFDGDHIDAAIAAAAGGLEAEGIRTEADVPDDFKQIDGAAFVGARQLNPKRIAVVQVGTRPGPDGIETYLNVERLTPEASMEAQQ